MSYSDCTIHQIKQTVLGLIIFHFIVLLALSILTWCVWDRAGQSFVKLKKTEKERNIKRTASRVERNLQRELRTQAKYEQNWDKRLRFWFCCTASGETQESAFSDIAILFSEFFRDLDVVPTDVLAGLMLLREEQKQRRRAIENSPQNSVFKFLSGVAVTPETKFLDLHKAEDMDLFEELHYYFKFAAASYGWKGYVMVYGAEGCCTMTRECRCCCFKRRRHYHLDETSDPDADNCCMCNFAALKKMSGLSNNDIVYATFHVSHARKVVRQPRMKRKVAKARSAAKVWETPFFVALDHERSRVVVSIRGTLSVADIVTDLSADTSPISGQDEESPYQGHKGMVAAASYIKRRLIDDMLLHQAFTSDEERGTPNYQLLLVGHSLGAGIAAILGIMLKPDYPSLKVYAYSPPGGLLCKEASEHAAEFVTSLVVGKDVVARIGLSQMEFLRADLLNCIKMCRDPKWRVIMGELLCCCTVHSKNLAPVEDVDAPSPNPCRLDKAFHPTNHALVLSTHSPLFLPGRVLQIVRNNHKREGISRKDCAYYGIWRDLEDFSEVLISPVIIKDHLPGGVMTALNGCMEYGKRHGLPKRFSQVGRTPMSPPSPSQDFNQPPSSSSSRSSYLQMKPAREGGHTVHFQDSPSKSSGSSKKSSPTKRWGNKASESNNNLPSDLPSTPEERVPFLPYSSAEQSIPDDKLRTNSQNYQPIATLPNLASNEGGALHERLAPLASSESFTTTESARSSISSTSYSSVLDRFQGFPNTKDEGYCYYVANESQSTLHNTTEDSGEDSDKPNAVMTTATIESRPCNHDNKMETSVKTSPSPVGPWSLFRGGNSHMFDEEGNVKGRTSTDDRYTLTYDGMDLDPATGSEGGTDSPLSSRPHSSVGASATQPYVPEAKLGHGYTQYHPVSPDGFDTDDDIDDEALFASLRPGLYENHSKQPRKSFTLPVGTSLPLYGDDLEVKEGSPEVRPRRKRRRSLDTVSSATLTSSGSSHSSPQRQGETKPLASGAL
ncbi:sn1-specific diacylglycerol lipase alpha-like [Strongylocentrotus purpuratus]|uniref:sn-1-specific diacylglycerol lipase n=1 Tax=Strongylocentrotus purpuratus TaxID=7668 RepID=A0A7M7T2X0_STRPU|nr:sn1-specific diacylglycerol lipase alpha-like [Strongylocentrotus purpuratus]